MAYEAEVQRGITLLDEKTPGWRSRIDLDRLDMLWASPATTAHGRGRCCIGAQLADTTDGETYYEWAEQLSGYYRSDEYDKFKEWAYTHGFAAQFGTYDELTAAWRRALGGGAS